MSDKFDFDNFKNIDSSGRDSVPVSELDLEAILRDYGENKQDNKSEIKQSEQQLSQNSCNIENAEVKRPQGISITGTFDAIHSEKAASKTAVLNGDDTAGIDFVRYDSVTEQKELNTDANTADAAEGSDLKNSGEITEQIPAKKFIDTETFESIKNQSKHKKQNPIVEFALGDNEEEDVEGEEIPAIEPTEEIDDYENEEQREDIVAELKRMKSSASFKTLLTFILTCISGLLFAALQTGFSFPGIDIAYDIGVYIPFILSVSAAATLINIVSVFNGIKSIFKFKFVSESFVVLIFIFSTVLDVCYIVLKTPVQECIVFDFIYMLMLLFCINSKRIIANNIYKGFAVVSADGSKMVLDTDQNDELINDIIVDTGCSNDIAYAARSNFISNYISRSFSDYELCNKYSAPGIVLFFLPLAVGLVNYIMLGSFTTCIKSIVGIFTAVTPLLQGMNFAVSVYTNGKKVRKNGGTIVGTDSCFDLNDVQTVVIDDSDIFTAALNGIRFYGDYNADDMILYLNSLYSVAGGPLKTLFGNMLSEDIKKLPRIDDIYFHENMGYSSLINSKVFLAGNKELMEHFGIEIDYADFETIYKQKSKHILFTAYDGRLSGVFLLSYSLAYGVSRAFKTYEKDQVCVVIAQHDQNINSDTLFYHYETNEKLLFKIMNFGNAQKCIQKFKTSNNSPSQVVSRTGILGLSYGLHGCKSIKFALSAAKVIKIISAVIAACLMTFLAFFSGMTAALPLQILAYHILWAVPAMFVSVFSK